MQHSSAQAPAHRRQDHKDAARSSTELRELFTNRNADTSSSSAQEARKSPFRKTCSPFPFRPTLTILLLPLSLLPIILLSAAAELASQSYIRTLSCYPNGLWKFSTGATWEIMDSTYFFTPNLSFGTLSFTHVKVIDIAWDLCVGRGGQILLAWVNYRVFNEWIVWHMECHLTSYKFYAAVAFETTSLGTLGVLGKEFLAGGNGNAGWRGFVRWLAVFCMLISGLYVLSFPTLVAAMTGYIAKSEPYLEDFGGNLIGFGKVDAVRYVVEDATRIGYDQQRLVVTESNTGLVEEVLKYMNSTPTDSSPEELPQNQSKWTAPSLSSNWRNYTLSAPSLTITTFPIDKDIRDGLDPQSTTHWAVLNQSELYTSAYVLSHGSCKPGEQYQWGFSYIFLFMMSVFNFVWASIMVGMWLDTRRGSRAYKSGRRPGLLRCVVEFARVVREEVGDGVEDMEEDEIRERLRNGGMLRVDGGEGRMKSVQQRDEGFGKRKWTRSLTRGSTF